jgi:hypothetical protein
MGEIRRDSGCLAYSGALEAADKIDKVMIFGCHGQKGNQHWIYNKVCLILENIKRFVVFLE